MTEEWIEGHTTPGRWPDKAFSATLKAIYPGVVGAKEASALKLDFEGDIQLAVFGIDKVQADGTVPGFTTLGKFLDSLTAQAVKHYWSSMTQDGIPVGFKTEPDLVGCKLTMKPLERKVVGEAGEQIYRDWVLEKYEKPKAAAAPTPAKARDLAKTREQIAKTAAPSEALVEQWKETLVDLPEPMNEGGIMKHLKTVVQDEKLRKQLNDVRKPTLEGLVREGFLTVVDGKYSVVGVKYA